MNPELFRPQEAADYLKISKRSLEILKGKGQVAYIKIGGSIRYRKPDLDAFLESKAVQPEPSTK